MLVGTKRSSSRRVSMFCRRSSAPSLLFNCMAGERAVEHNKITHQWLWGYLLDYSKKTRQFAIILHFDEFSY